MPELLGLEHIPVAANEVIWCPEYTKFMKEYFSNLLSCVVELGGQPENPKFDDRTEVSSTNYEV